MTAAPIALAFRVQFHAPLTSAAALGRDGFDIALHADPIGGDGIKGAMRRIGRVLLTPKLLDAAFGSARAPSPWHWSCLERASWDPHDRHRVEIDSDTGAAREDNLVRAEYVWPDDAKFTITQTGSDAACTATRLAITACARGVTALGAWTNRAYGWVQVTPLDASGAAIPLIDEDLDLIAEWSKP